MSACACGCGLSLEGGRRHRRFASTACRMRYMRRRGKRESVTGQDAPAYHAGGLVENTAAPTEVSDVDGFCFRPQAGRSDQARQGPGLLLPLPSGVCSGVAVPKISEPLAVG